MSLIRSGKYFLIRSQMNDNLVLENDLLDETNVSISPFLSDYSGNNSHQLWFYNSSAKNVTNKKTNMCLQALGHKIKALKRQYKSQCFTIDINYIRLNDSNLVVELVGGTACELKPQNGSTIMQMWRVDNLPALYFYIKSRAKPGLVVDVRGDDKAAGAKVILYENKHDMSDNQLWCEDERGRLRNKLNDFLMDVNKHNEVVVNPYLDEDSRGWVLEGGCKIVNLGDTNLIISHKHGGIFLGGPRVVATSRHSISKEVDTLWDFEFMQHQSISLNHSGSGKDFIIRNRKTGKTLEVMGESVVKGCSLQLVSCNLIPSLAPSKQQFYRDDFTGTIRNCLRNFAIEATEKGLILNGFDPYNKMQQWILKLNKLHNRHDPSLLIQADPEDDCQVSVGSDQNLQCQQWEFCHVPAKCFHIQSLICDKVIDVRGSKASAGAYVILYDLNSPPSDNQIWYEDECGLLRSKLNGYVLDTSEDKVKVVPYNPESMDQHWVIVGDRIENRYDNKMVIDLKGENTFNSTSLIKYKFHGGENQRWKFLYIN